MKVGLISGHRVIITSHRAQMTAPCSCQGPGGSHQVSPAAPGRALRASLAIWRHWQRLAHRIHTPAGTTAIPLRGTTLLLAVETSEVTVWHIEPICSASEDLSLELLQYCIQVSAAGAHFTILNRTGPYRGSRGPWILLPVSVTWAGGASMGFALLGRLFRRPSGALTAALADQQRPQRCLFVLSGLALQSWGALRDVDPARLPLSPETASGLCTAVCRRPRVFLLHPWPAAGAPR